MEWWCFWRFIACSELRHFRNPFRRFGDYYQSRGMSLWTDIRDWLGGWPMEFAGIMEARTFCQKELGLKLVWMTAEETCTEYLFCRQGDAATLEQARGEVQIVPLPGPFLHQQGLAFSYRLPELQRDEVGKSRLVSDWVQFEEEAPLTYPRAKIRAIDRLGMGRS